MDKLTRYREIIREELKGYADWLTNPKKQIRFEVVFDPVLDHFELVEVGWDEHRRVHFVLFHLDIIDGKVWVQHDGTAEGLAVWEWLQQFIDPMHRVVNEREAEIASYLCYAEALLSGTTTIVDMWRHMHGSAKAARWNGETAAMIAAYETIRPLTDAEREALPTLCRGAALRFFATRLTDWGDTPAGAMVKPKDPLEYADKLAFHRNAKGAGDYGA